MKILFLCSVLPHAQVVSGVINVYQRLRLLAGRGHEVSLACFTGPAEDPAAVASVRDCTVELEMVPRPDRALPLFGTERFPGIVPMPFRAMRDAAFARRVGQMVARQHPDIVVAEFTVMGQYLHANPYLPPVRRVISCHGCLTVMAEKAVNLRPWRPSSFRRGLCLPWLEAFEFSVYRAADLVVTLTGEERYQLLQRAPDLRTTVVPYGVDIEHFRPAPKPPAEPALVFTGYFADEANADAVRWFVRHAWPALKTRHPALQLFVVGQDPDASIRLLARQHPGVTVTGTVTDVAPYLNRASVYVCPMRMGSGFRGKILQAMAAGVPVVATSLGAEGIPAEPGHNLVLADTADAMVRNISLLLDDPVFRHRLAVQARRLVEERFSWPVCVDRFEQAISAVRA